MIEKPRKVKSGPYKGHHETKRIKLNGRTVSIDHNIVDMIKRVNELGIETVECCGSWDRKRNKIFSQDKSTSGQECVCVSFPSSQESKRFIDIMCAENDTKRFRGLISGRIRGRYSWRWSFGIVDVSNLRCFNGGKWIARDLVWPPNIETFISVAIPHSYYDLIMDRLNAAKQKNKKHWIKI